MVANYNVITLTPVSATAVGILGAANQQTIDTTNSDWLAFQLKGPFVGNVVAEASFDGGTTWDLLPMVRSVDSTIQTAISSTGLWFVQTIAPLTRLRVSSYTSGTIQLVGGTTDVQDAPNIATARAAATGDGIAAGSVDEVAVGALNSASNIDRLRTAGAVAGGAGHSYGLHVGTGGGVAASINAATAPAFGSNNDNVTARAMHTLQVDVTTTTAGTAGTHSVVLEGSLDGTNFTTLATVSPSSTSTTATDASNHANASVANMPYRVIRARWLSIPTSWVGTLTARVVSA